MVTKDRSNACWFCRGPGIFLLVALLAAVVISVFPVGQGTAQESGGSADSSSQSPLRAEVKDKQLDVALEARDIERVLGKLKRASDLSKQRITDAAQVAESASGALDRGDSQSAREDAQQAAAMFQEIAKQLEALLAEETPQRIAAAQNLAQQLSQAERQFLRQFPGAMTVAGNGMGKIDPRSPVKPQGKQGSGGQGKKGLQKKSDDPEKKSGSGGKKGQDPQGAGDQKQKSGSPSGSTSKDGKMPAEDEKKKQAGAGNGADKGAKEGAEKGAGKSEKGAEEGAEKGDSGQGSNKGSQDKGTDDAKSAPGGGGAGDEKSDMPRGGKGASDGEQKDAGEDQTGDGAGEPTEEEMREALARRARQLAESGKTLDDILKTIVQSTDPADAEAVRMVTAILKETDLTQAIANMEQAVATIQSGDLDDARLATLDAADRLEITSQRLGNAYRLIVAPQAEELRDIEKALSILREKLDQLETPAQIAAWHREIRELLDRLDKLGISEELLEKFIEEMKTAGIDVSPGGKVAAWSLVDGRYVAPATYRRGLISIQEEVQSRLQNLLLGDLESLPDEATPPKYQELVERYYQVLSRDGGRRDANVSPPPDQKK